jgi:hypothetical protein
MAYHNTTKQMKHIKAFGVMVLFIALSLQVYGFGTVSHGYTHSAGGNNSGGNDAASGEPLPCGISCNNTMWFIYNPTVNGTLTVDTFGSNFDTVMAIYTGPGDSYATLVQVGCNDDISGTNNQSVLTFTAQAGTNYFIQVGGKGSASGTIALHIELIPTLVIRLHRE